MGQNLEYQTAMNSMTGQRGQLQPTNDGEDGVEKSEEGYSWTQTDDEIEITVTVAIGTSSKDIKIKFSTKVLKVSVKGKETIALDLYAPIDPDGSTWTLHQGEGGVKVIVITCEKRDA